MEELTKKELYDLNHQNKKSRVEVNQGDTNSGKGFKKIFIIILLIALFVLLGWYLVTNFSVEEEDIVARGGIHIHPNMDITIKGKRIDLPANIGISGGGGHGVAQPYHTHVLNDSLHIEPIGLVTKEDIKLARFFDAWGEEFNSECIFDNCNGAEGQLRMIVNGEPNFDFENYLLQDNDLIEIIYE